MSTRRRLLLALLSAVKWVVNRFTYIYNSIVPSGDYKKARLGKIEGNGEIANQLHYNGDGSEFGTTFTQYTKGWFVSTSYSTPSMVNGKIRLSCVSANYITFDCRDYGGNTIQKAIQGHKYFMVLKCYLSLQNTNKNVPLLLKIENSYNNKTLTANSNVTIYDILEAPAQGTKGFNTQIGNSSFGNFATGDYLDISYFQIIDLTKEFGTGNEPTSLTDNRIKRIIAKGYIPTNSGTYDSSVVKEIESLDSENNLLGKLQLPQPIKLNGNTTDNDSFAITSSAYVFTRKVWGTDNTTFPTTLQTPQVISIPKKHLGCVRLKDLEWTKVTSASHWVFSATVNNKRIGREYALWSCKYRQVITINLYVEPNMSIGASSQSETVFIKDERFLTANDFLASLINADILFFETKNEVTDFTNSLDIQSGGFLNAKQLLDEICEVLPNVELEMRK